MYDYLPPKPYHPSPAVRERWKEQARREQMLDGDWTDHLRRQLEAHFTEVRREVIGPPDKSSNVFRDVVDQTAILYDTAPTVTHADLPRPEDDPGAFLGAGGPLAATRWWLKDRQVQRHVYGLHEGVAALCWSPSAQRVQIRVVLPSMVEAEGHPDDPQTPVRLHEWRLRHIPAERRQGAGGPAWWWTVDVYDLRETPAYKICLLDKGQPGEDVTALYDPAGARVGDAYPYRWTRGARAGEAFIPYVIWHERDTGQMWTPWSKLQLVDGSLNAAVLYSWWFHCTRDASWPQRVGVNVRPVGGDVVMAGGDGNGSLDAQGGRGVRRIATDPASLLLLETVESGSQPLLKQFEPGCDPDALLLAVQQYELRLATYAGLSLSHLERNHGTPTSGYAVSVKESGKRVLQRRYLEQARLGDLALIERIAALENIFARGEDGARLPGHPEIPESGYAVRYRRIAKSPEELAAEQDRDARDVAMGVLSVVDVYLARHPGMTRDQALRDLEEIRRLNERFGVLAGRL